MEDKQKKQFISTIIMVIIIAVIIVTMAIGLIKKNSNHNDENIQNKDNTNNQVEEQVEEYVKEQDGIKTNISDKLRQSREFEGYKVDKIELTSQSSQTQLIAEMTNNSGVDKTAMLIDIVLLDKDGNEIVTLGGIIPATNAGETSQLNVNSSLNYANAYDFKIIKK